MPEDTTPPLVAELERQLDRLQRGRHPSEMHPWTRAKYYQLKALLKEPEPEA